MSNFFRCSFFSLGHSCVLVSFFLFRFVSGILTMAHCSNPSRKLEGEKALSGRRRRRRRTSIGRECQIRTG